MEQEKPQKKREKTRPSKKKRRAPEIKTAPANPERCVRELLGGRRRSGKKMQEPEEERRRYRLEEGDF